MLALLIGGGVVVILTLTVLVSGAHPAQVDEASARALFALDRPGQPIEHVLIATDQRVAIVVGGGSRQVVFPVGARLAIRPLHTARREGASWRLDFGDYGAPTITVAFPDSAAEVLLA